MGIRPIDRLAADRYTIPAIPEAVARYAQVPDTLPVGSPGKVGVLDLVFERRGERTELTGHYQKTPLQIMRPLYHDPSRPDLACVMVIAVGGGVLQGDRYRLDLTCGADASVYVTTQAATKIYRMEQDYATQLVSIAVGPGGSLEYLPGPVIPFAGSRFYQRTRLTVDPSATVILGETMLAGRLARGERHAYTAYCSDLDVHRPAGDLLFADPVRLVPAQAPVTGPAMFGGHGVLSTLYVVTAAVAAGDLAGELHEAATRSGLTGGAGVLPGGAGAWARLLGPETPRVTATLEHLWDIARRMTIGSPAPDRRKP
ncbi:urease accessory protein UreD [Sphaerisporangium siamense]|uniref:Urease accessory protein UreD n=1 Tax=Sphaerisporangium siamense TaxID=795645 RepID=A0A7W7DE36_9ACTN|nr:urease accessory protein UreD [Sphaerisporangium siamense]MBB4705092.1 urease accessory protein [Sphaerisporangium siamense]GII83897.1 urease accessory protein UreD [Sphaerisporangium siamense]